MSPSHHNIKDDPWKMSVLSDPLSSLQKFVDEVLVPSPLPGIYGLNDNLSRSRNLPRTSY